MHKLYKKHILGDCMDIREFQLASAHISEQIRQKRGVSPSEYVTFLHIVEELGEIARELYNAERKREAFSEQHLGEEFADVLMLIAEFAHRKNIDLEKAICEKIKHLKQRHAL